MKSAALFTALFLAILLGLSCDAYAQNSKGYFPEDWVTYAQSRYVTSIAMGWSDIYFGTTHGIIRYNSLERKWRDPMTSSDGLPSDEIWRLAVNKDNDVVYVQTPLGVYSYDPTFQEWRSEFDFPDSLVVRSALNQLNFEAYHFDLGYHFSYYSDQTYLTDPFLRDYQVTTAYEDQWDHLWVATYGDGISDIDLGSDFVTLLPFGPYDETVNTLYIDDDNVWFGSKTGIANANAITLWNRRDDQWKYFEGKYNDWIVSDEVNAITSDDKSVYFATDYGLVKYNKKRGSFRSYTKGLGLRSSDIYSVYVEDSLVFIGGLGTVDILLTPKDSILPFSAPTAQSGEILTMDHIGDNFWIGTEYGLQRLNTVTLEWTKFNIPSGYLGGMVWQIVPGKNGELWFAGSDGVIHLDSNLTAIESFLTRTDLGNRMPHRIALTGNILWIGTDNGVMKYDRVHQTWKTYTTSDGLIDNYVNDMIPEGDHIWFATPRGATRFYWNNPLRVRED